jgi:hypothetical protein
MRLAGFLKMRLDDLLENMGSREFSYWVAYSRYYEPIGGEWEQAGLIASAALAPYCPRGQTPRPRDFVPTEKPPQHQVQINQALADLQGDLEDSR